MCIAASNFVCLTRTFVFFIISVTTPEGSAGIVTKKKEAADAGNSRKANKLYAVVYCGYIYGLFVDGPGVWDVLITRKNRKNYNGNL